MQDDIVKTHEIAGRMDVHFAHTLGMVAACRQQPGQRHVVVPVDMVVVADETVVALGQSSEDCGARRHTGWGGGICLGEVDAVVGQAIQMRRLNH